MKYSFNTQKQIIELKEKGFASRYIADKLQISKSGVNEFWNAYVTVAKQKKNGPRVLFFDLETSAALVYCFGRHKQFINQDAVKIEGGKLLCSGYRWLDEDSTTVVYHKTDIAQHQDYSVCLVMWQLFSQADVVVAHNLKGFDFKMLEARCLANGLPPLPTVQLVDTLDIAKKKFRLPSNKLDSLAAYLGIGRKVVNTGISLWVKVQEGDEQALSDMIEYCEHDVDLLYEVFMELRGRGLVSSVNFANYYDDNTPRCKSCGSDHLHFTGRTVTTPTGLFDEVACGNCGTLQRTKENKLSKDKRKSLMAAPRGAI